MGIATAVIASAEDYQRALAEYPVLFLLFVSPHCPACREAGPLFERIARQNAEQVKSMILDTTQTLRHPEVTGTPTLLVFRNGQMIEKLKGFGVWEEHEHTINNLFKRHAKGNSPAAMPR
ncbi:thioredoxin family protein [Pseudomonas sp. SDO5271_S396]